VSEGEAIRRTYLITGASGIGAETARVLAKQGQRLFIVARTEDKCRDLVAQLRQLGGEAEYRACDLTEMAAAADVVGACVQRFGRLDGLFNVAGISGRRYGDGPAHECTEQGWATTINTNVTTQYRMCREGLRVMLAQKPLGNGQRGVILNMSSILGLDPEPAHFDTIAYAAAKGAIVSMSRTMAASYMKNKIRVNVIAPALVHTPMSARASEDPVIVDFMKIKQPLVEAMIPVEDVASACVFLLTDASRSMTGEVMKVDAGWSLA
jgi:NAD(P)-dependent dehydrogenase (short-subunit alcohol dehydrogenase family)